MGGGSSGCMGCCAYIRFRGPAHARRCGWFVFRRVSATMGGSILAGSRPAQTADHGVLGAWGLFRILWRRAIQLPRLFEAIHALTLCVAHRGGVVQASSGCRPFGGLRQAAVETHGRVGPGGGRVPSDRWLDRVAGSAVVGTCAEDLDPRGVMGGDFRVSPGGNDLGRHSTRHFRAFGYRTVLKQKIKNPNVPFYRYIVKVIFPRCGRSHFQRLAVVGRWCTRPVQGW